VTQYPQDLPPEVEAVLKADRLAWNVRYSGNA
jgi:hypothetical protein